MQNGDGRLGRRDRHQPEIGGEVEGSVAIWNDVIWRHFHHTSKLVMCSSFCVKDDYHLVRL